MENNYMLKQPLLVSIVVLVRGAVTRFGALVFCSRAGESVLGLTDTLSTIEGLQTLPSLIMSESCVG